MSIFSKLKSGSSLCCRDVNEFLVLYLEEGLDENVRRRFEAHLGQCSKCSAYLDQYRTTVSMVHESEPVPPPPEVLVDYTLAFIREHYDESEDEA